MHPLVGCLLRSRGVSSVDEGARFLHPSLEHLHDPFLLPDARPAVERLAEAIRAGEKILVHGDYDVDGVCAAALTTRVLRVLKGNVEVFVPHRRVDGYDLQVETVRRAAADGVKVIVTVDCGILAFESAEAARELGIDLIVTDHHEPHPSGRLPRALAVVNPKCPGSAYPFQELCGTGVAYKLTSALVQHLGVTSPAFRTAFLDLVALATCADCMPLVDENRVLVKAGLEVLRSTNKAGLKALMRVAGQEPRTVSTRSLGFVLAPRINAIGRLDAAEHALKLLLTGDEREATELAQKLDDANRERQQEQERLLQDAMRQASHYVDDRILVLGSPKWHPGIIGIAASKVAESLCRPTVMVAIDEEAGTARGSCRSVEGFHILQALEQCRELLVRFGGHQAAAGFEIEPQRLEELRAKLQEVAVEGLDEELLQPCVRIDAEIPLADLSLPLVKELSLLEPYGQGNREPVFVSRGLSVLEQRRLSNKAGAERDHLKLRLRHPALPRGLEAVFWRNWLRSTECPVDTRIDTCYALEVNQYGGTQSLQLRLLDLRPSTPA
ncbi:MAG: single-stranded-DNA-specific exonuclease RecJ [Armatimonadota bacterium]